MWVFNIRVFKLSSQKFKHIQQAAQRFKHSKSNKDSKSDPIKVGLFTAACVICALKTTDRYFVSCTMVTGFSMQPTLNPVSETKDKVLLDVRPSWDPQRLKRGDIVTYRCTRNPDEINIKRLVGLEGDVIATVPGTGYKKKVVEVPPGHCWVEGDNHLHSDDSNHVGPIPLGLITGRATHVIFPFSRYQPLVRKFPHSRVKVQGDLINNELRLLQTILMDCEWWDGRMDLAKDIHDTLKSRENNMLRLKGVAKNMVWRRYLVDWIALTCQKFRLNSNAQHLAVCLYDRFTDKYHLPNEDIQMLIICCLLVASKFEEREEKIPKFNILMDYLQWNLLASKYLEMEIQLLSSFEWDIGFPTASHFKEYYMQVAIGTRDIHVGQPLVNREEAYTYLTKNVNYFLEISLQDQSFLLFKPSLVMASCIASSRICLHLIPTWTVELQKTTCFSWHHLSPCIEILLRLYDEDRKANLNRSKHPTLPNSMGTNRHSGLNSTGTTPVTSPVPPHFAPEMHRAPTVPSIVPSYRYNRGYLV